MKRAIDAWVREELATMRLPDRRLTARALQMVQALSEQPTASIAQFSGDWASAKAVYRLLHHPAVARESIVAAQRQATWQRMAAHPLVLCVQDTSDVNLTHYPSVRGAGSIPQGNRQGFLMHTTLAVLPNGLPLGVLAQQVWVRQPSEAGKAATRKARLIEDKESYKWLHSLRVTVSAAPAGTKLLFVSDAESDILDYFLHPRPAHVDLLVRAAQERRLADAPGLLWASVRTEAVAGHVTIDVAAHAGEPARQAHCQVRYRAVQLRPTPRPAHLPKRSAVALWAVLVEETTPPAQTAPLCWALLTTLPVTSFADACQIVQFYLRRWLIERFHYVLKSGCRLEQRRLATVAAIARFLAFANVVAWRLLWLTYLARLDPQLPASVALREEEWQPLDCFMHQTPTPAPTPPTLQQAVRWIAQLGGYLARPTDPEPGVKVLWQGWQRLADLSQAWSLFRQPTHAPP
jgi:hypothetical protein